MRKESGPNIDAVLELGRKLAASYEDHDLTARWMAHHLAELVTAAEDDSKTTVEQRTSIIETILQMWRFRRSAPGKVPGFELDQVYNALDRLGDASPWHFAGLTGFGGVPIEEQEAPLVVIAVGLERMARETIIALVWQACQDAIAADAPWTAVAEAVGEDLDDQILASTQTIRRRLRSLAGDEDEPLDSAQHGDAEVARRLRRMSGALADLATAIEQSGSPGED